MGLASLELIDFRSFRSAHFAPDPDGTTVLLAPNGTGKTSLLEAVGYLGTGRSFRGATRVTYAMRASDHGGASAGRPGANAVLRW